MVSPLVITFGDAHTPSVSPEATRRWSRGTWCRWILSTSDPCPGVILKHFTARDVVSRWDVVEVRTRATANTATDFLSTLQARMPFPVRAIQVDGGSEFQAGFEQACQE